MSRPCVCGGSNENCRYCNGRGEIRDGLATALTIHSQRPEYKKVNAVRKEKTKVTGQVHRKSEGGRELGDQATKFDRSSSLTLRNQALTSPSLIACPRGCGARLNAKKVDKHLRKVHRVERYTALPTAGGRTISPALKACPFCTAQVQKLDRHIRKVHWKFKQAVQKIIVRSAPDVLRHDTTLVAPRDTNLDATKLYAHSYRENGRFGSHPAHDGFDDESGPDD